MKIIFLKSTWGMEGALVENLQQIKSDGFDGVEMGAPASAAEQLEVKAILADLDLRVVIQQWTEGSTAMEHIQSFEAQFRNGLEMKPLLINSHTGKDWYPFEDNLRIFDAAEELAQKNGVRLVHETHRGRATFCTTACNALLDARPGLQFAADFSHWCCVHESLLQDQEGSVERLSGNSYHIHARVGHTQSPQINDPRAGEWSDVVNLHLTWWDRIVEMRKKEGLNHLTICPEFGPYPYMPEQPFSRKPLAGLCEINQHMHHLLRKRYS
jgi:sugar phosphate isomerase/epimerase